MDIIEILCNSNYAIYNLELAKRVGVEAAILVGELARKYNYWSMNDRLFDGCYFFISREDILNDTGLSYSYQEKATKRLKDLGILSVERKGGFNRTNYYKINTDVLSEYVTPEVAVSVKQVAATVKQVDDSVKVSSPNGPVASVRTRLSRPFEQGSHVRSNEAERANTNTINTNTVNTNTRITNTGNFLNNQEQVKDISISPSGVFNPPTSTIVDVYTNTREQRPCGVRWEAGEFRECIRPDKFGNLITVMTAMPS